MRVVREQIADCGMLSAHDRWLVAVSGGADSMALLAALVRLREGGMRELEYVHVGHLNHGLRGAESEADAALVEAAARRAGLEVTVGAADVRAAAERRGVSVELAGREERYRFLTETAEKTGCRKIAVGHTADDNVETILQRLIRGTGIRGLAGIPAARELPGAVSA